ncbi:hypothetical protein SCLCIDRAFT_129844, partial [Scleroderma citrinum Foug A]
ERVGLADEVEIAIGMEVMVTFNVSTDLDVANGVCGHIVDIILDARESNNASMTQVKFLEYPPVYILVRMIRTKANMLDGLEARLPITPAYTFTDYRSQAQTIDHCIIHLATPPLGN